MGKLSSYSYLQAVELFTSDAVYSTETLIDAILATKYNIFTERERTFFENKYVIHKGLFFKRYRFLRQKFISKQEYIPHKYKSKRYINHFIHKKNITDIY